MIAHLVEGFSNNLDLALRWSDLEHLYQEVNELLAKGILEQVILEHEAMVVEPDLFVELLAVECVDLVKGDDPFSFVLSQYDIGLEFLLIQQHIGVGAGAHTSPFVTLEVTPITFGLHAGMWEHIHSGVVELDPADIFLGYRPVVSHLWSP